ncbi:MAG: restriction endonuclease subunit S [Clostridia bacterium]|nr:restriction endonuclease subunit S [Clostridia bacterium]
MMKTNFISRLLQGVETEWKKLDDVAIKISSGGTPRTGVSEYYDGNIPWLRTQEVDFGEIWDTGVKITDLGLKNSSAKRIPANCVIVAMYGATVGKIGINKIPLSTNQACANIQLDDKIVNYRYVFHYLTSKYEHIKSLGSGSQTNINAKIVKNYPIPIPCPENPEKSLEIQAEIVRILDAFTELTAELIAELTEELIARKKQYTYYRDKLLTFEKDEVEWKNLGEIGKFTRGKRFVKTDMLSDGFPCIHYGEMYTHYNIWADKSKSFVSNDLASKLRVANHGDVVIVAAGETIEDIGKGTAWLGNTEVVIHDACFSYRSTLNPKYVSYFLRTKLFHDQIKKYISSGKISAINADGLSKARIAIPPIEEQTRIVSILDKYETLTSSIIEDLSLEIELRQKQYVYYRNMLLSFPNEEVKA